MGIYIPNMEKPKDCRKCPRRIQYDDGWSVRNKCLELNRDIDYEYGDLVVMQNDCPLIEIDDELFKKAENAYVLQQIRNR